MRLCDRRKGDLKLFTQRNPVDSDNRNITRHIQTEIFCGLPGNSFSAHRSPGTYRPGMKGVRLKFLIYSRLDGMAEPAHRAPRCR